MKKRSAVLVAALATTLVSACSSHDGEPTEEAPASSTRDELRSGTVTWERPEVGFLHGCTGTLVAPNVVVTAAHCYGFASKLTPGNHGKFSIHTTSGATAASYTVDLIKVYNP